MIVGLVSMVLAIPLAVLRDASGPYDDPKVWMLLWLAAATGLAWLASPRRGGVISGPGSSGPRLRGLRIIVVAYLVWAGVMTVFSVAPGQSLLGGFGRGMGFLTMTAAVLAFFLAQSECRTRESVRLLVDAVLLGSLPVCLLALGQAVGWNALPEGWDPAQREMTVRSTFGSHIFLGSYLLMLIPLTLARIEWALRERSTAGRWAAPRREDWLAGLAVAAWVVGAVGLVVLASQWSIAWWALAPWGILGAVGWTRYASRLGEKADSLLGVLLLTGLLLGQVLIVVLTRGRGAFIGMVVGLSVTSLAFLVQRRAWKTLSLSGLGLALLIGFLVLLNWPGSPVARLGRVQLLNRLSEIGNVQPGSPGWVRLQVWRGISESWRRQLSGEEVVPGVSPRIRSVVGYGPETQIVVLEPMTSPLIGLQIAGARGVAWRAFYVVDRSHNVTFDHLVTEGLVGVSLWALLMAGVVAVGISRVRRGGTMAETSIRLGALGAVLGHLADGQLGMATPMPLVLFWLVAALVTAPPWTASVGAREAIRADRGRRWARAAMVIVGALLAVVIAWTSTRWLLASLAYAAGVRHGLAVQLSSALGEFRRSGALAPWLPGPAESTAYTALRLAGSETDPSRRADLLREAETALARIREHSMFNAASWALAGQVALAKARAGEPGQLAVSRDAFAAALRLSPTDARLMAQLAWSLLETGDVPGARQTAERALAQNPGEWLAWAVLSRAARNLGDLAGSERFGRTARALAPAGARRVLDTLLR